MPSMLVYQRYIAKNILLPFLIIALVITGMVWATQILRLVSLLDQGIGLKHFGSLVVLVIPSLLLMVMPFVTVLACLYTYHRLSSERQLTILKSCGLSNLALARPALLIAALASIGAYYISAQLLPLSCAALRSKLNLLKTDYVMSVIHEKTFTPISKHVTIYINKKTTDGRMLGLILFDNRHQASPAVIFAASGEYQQNDHHSLRLYSGSRQSYDHNGSLTKLHFASLTVELSSRNSQLLQNPKSDRDINEYYIHELLAPSTKLSLDKQRKLKSAGHQRIIWPLYNFVLTFLALAVYLPQSHNKKFDFKPLLLTALAIVISTYCHFSLQNMVTKNLIFAVGCYANLAVNLIFSTWLYYSRSI